MWCKPYLSLQADVVAAVVAVAAAEADAVEVCAFMCISGIAMSPQRRYATFASSGIC
jgi:hypothetical protein